MNIDYDSLFKGVSTELKPLYLIYGQEQYLVDTVVNKIKKTFGEMLLGINYIMIDESNVDNIISDIEMPAFGYDKKLIIVKNSGLFKKDGRKKAGSPIQEKIAEYIKENFDVNILSFIFRTFNNNQSKLNNSKYKKINSTPSFCEGVGC